MPTNTLTDAQCKRAVATDKPVKLFDGGGLHLYVSCTGSKTWRLAFRLDGKPQQVSFGAYPLTGLAEARRKRDEFKAALQAGNDPRVKRSHAPLFRDAALAYWEGRADISVTYRSKTISALQRHLFPSLGDKRLDAITRSDLLAALLPVDTAGKFEQVRNLRQWADQIFERGIELEQCKDNPAATIRSEKAFSKADVRHMPALELSQVPEFMGRLNLEEATTAVMMCRMLALTWTRTHVLRQMKWSEVQGDLWRIPGSKMKMKRDLLVPLSRQAMVILGGMRMRSTGSDFVFPHPTRRDRPASNNAVLSLLYRMGYKGEMTGHGWRSVGSTWANENGWNADAIERQLAHVPADEVRGIYNRAQYMDQRRAMLQAWADWLMPDVDACGDQS